MSRLVVTVSGTGGPPGIAPPITWVDANNNFVLNGSPMLLSQGEGMDYASWFQVGYTETEADAMIQQAQSSGLNVIGPAQQRATYAFAAPYGTIAQIAKFWQKFGLYFHGDANKGVTTVDPLIGDATSLNGMLANIAADKDDPGMLLWAPLGEADVTDPSGGATPTAAIYCQHWTTASQLLRQADPAHAVVSGDAVKSSSLHTWHGNYPTDDAQFYAWDQLVNRWSDQIPFVEAVIQDFGGAVWVQMSKIYEYLVIMYGRVIGSLPVGTGWTPVNYPTPGGNGWIPSISITPIAELLGLPAPANQLPTYDQINRYQWMQVAFQCRAFSMLWGPNQRTVLLTQNLSAPAKISLVSSAADTRTVTVEGTVGGVVTDETVVMTGTTPVLTTATFDQNTDSTHGLKWVGVSPSGAQIITVQQGSGGTTLGTVTSASGSAIYAKGNLGLPDGHLTVWDNYWTVMGNITSLASVLLAPANWTQITATSPAWVGFNFGNNGVFAGIYACKKTVGGFLYVIALNFSERQSDGAELSITGGTVDVGQTINTCVRVAGESGNPSFAGSVITDNFVSMGVHVYKIT